MGQGDMKFDRSQGSRAFEKLVKKRGGVSSITTTHILVEYALNVLVMQNCDNSRVILDDRRSYTFSVKLNLVYGMGLLTKKLYHNIMKLNKIRNAYAHKLDVDFSTFDLDFHDPAGKIDFKIFKAKGFFSSPPAKSEVERVAQCIHAVTFGWIFDEVFGKNNATDT